MIVNYRGLAINYSRLERPLHGDGQRTAPANLARALLWVAEQENLVKFRARVRRLERVDERTLLAMEVAQTDKTLVSMTEIASLLDVVDADRKQETARWWSAARHYLDTTIAEWPPSREILTGRRPVDAKPGSGVGSYPSHRGVLPPPEIRTSGQPRWFWGDIRRWAMQNGRMNHLGTEVHKLANAAATSSSPTNGKRVAIASSQVLVQVAARKYLRLNIDEVPPFVLGLLHGAAHDLTPALYRTNIDMGAAAPAPVDGVVNE